MLAQYLWLFTVQIPLAWLDFPPCRNCIFTINVHSSSRCSTAALVYTEAPLEDPAPDLAVGSKAHLEAPEGYTTIDISSRIHEEIA